MELLLITKTRLKIVMTSEDMKKYAITCDDADTDEDEIRAVLRSILEQAKNKVGFDLNGNGVSVKMFPSKDGGCEMYVTRARDENTSLPVPVHRKKREQDTVFGFFTLQDLLDACRHLMRSAEILQSRAYEDAYKKKYYLLLRTEERDAFGKNPCLWSVANEYGRMLKSDGTLWWLTEHCHCFCERDAVKTLGALA